MFSLETFTKIRIAWTKHIPEPLQAIPFTLNEPKLTLVLGHETYLYWQLQTWFREMLSLWQFLLCLEENTLVPTPGFGEYVYMQFVSANPRLNNSTAAKIQNLHIQWNWRWGDVSPQQTSVTMVGNLLQFFFKYFMTMHWCFTMRIKLASAYEYIYMCVCVCVFFICTCSSYSHTKYYNSQQTLHK